MGARQGNGIGQSMVKISKRPLEMFYVVDTSGSMNGYKMDQVNKAMHELEIELKRQAALNTRAQVNIRILTFGGIEANWKVKEPTPIETFVYKDIECEKGVTPFNSALKELIEAFNNEDLPVRGFSPVIVLLSDGYPTDDEGNECNNWQENMDIFQSIPWVKKARKLAVAIGSNCDMKMLTEFTQKSEYVCQADKASQLTGFIKWTSVLVDYQTKPSVDDSDELICQDRENWMRGTVTNNDEPSF